MTLRIESLRAAMICACYGLTAACATDGAYSRWQVLREQPDQRAWAQCIEEQTQIRLSSALDTTPPGPEALDAQGKADAVVVVEILNACRPHMSGFRDGILADKRNKRMFRDAYDYYRMQETGIRAAEEAAIT